MKYLISFLAIMNIIMISCTNKNMSDKDDIVIENEQFKLIIQNDGITKSLLFKPTNEECLIKGEKMPVFSITQERPYHNEIKLSHPNKKLKFNANSIHWEGDKLKVGFELIPYEALVQVKVKPFYT